MKCFMCKSQKEKKLVNYMLDLNNTIIIIKDVPANVCSQCGERYFDDDVMENLEKIIDDVKKISMEISIISYKDKVA